MNIRTLIPATLSFLLLAGCGGGGATSFGGNGGNGGNGGGAGGSGGGGNPVSIASVALFATDAVDTKYDHVWITIREIDAIGDQGTAVLYKSLVGKTLDVRALNQAGVQRFSALGVASPAEGAYSRIRVVLDNNISLVPTGKTQAISRLFANSELEYNLPIGQKLEGKTSLVVDFDLSSWDDDGTHIKGVAKHRDGHGLDDSSKHETEDFHGAIAGLDGAAPNQTFELTTESGDIQVQLDSSTVIFADHSGASVLLADGVRVEVDGKLDAQAQTLKATSVKIEDKKGGETGSAEAKGSLKSISTSGLVLTLKRTHHFTPANQELTVSFGSGAMFLNEKGVKVDVDAFLKLAKAGTEIEVSGAYDETAKAFTASSVKLD